MTAARVKGKNYCDIRCGDTATNRKTGGQTKDADIWYACYVVRLHSIQHALFTHSYKHFIPKHESFLSNIHTLINTSVQLSFICTAKLQQVLKGGGG